MLTNQLLSEALKKVQFIDVNAIDRVAVALHKGSLLHHGPFANMQRAWNMNHSIT